MTASPGTASTAFIHRIFLTHPTYLRALRSLPPDSIRAVDCGRGSANA